MNNSGNIKVLVVDDEQIIRDLLTRTLKIAGCSVTTAADGLEGLEKIESTLCDVVICDMKMPRMDGETMISEVRKLKPNLPVLVITGNGGDEIAEKVQKLGVVDTIIKPFHNSEIVNSINKALLRKKKQGC